MSPSRALTFASGLTLLLLVLSVPVRSQGQSDPYEPNNDWDQAHGPMQARQTYTAFISQSDRDMFYIDVIQRGNFALTLRAIQEDAGQEDRVGLMLFSASEAPIQFVSAVRGTDARLERVLDPGRYFLDVNADARRGSVPYTIRIVSDTLGTVPSTPSAPITDPGRCAYFPGTHR